MASHVVRRIDPSPAEVREAWGEVFRRAAREALQGAGLPWDGAEAPDCAAVLDAAARLAAGVYSRRCVLDWRCDAVVLGACWWTDVVGRRHWYVQGEVAAEAQNWHGPVQGGQLPSCHPLEWIAPELASGWRTRGGRREYVVVCECGAAGTPAEVGWAGPCCGPCFDRRQDGLAAAGPAPLRRDVGPVDRFVLAAGGRLVTVRRDRGGSAPSRVVKAIDAPWAGRPAWARREEQGWARAVAAGGKSVALGDYFGRVTVVGLADGETRDVRQAEELDRLQELVYAGVDRSILVGLCDPGARGPVLRAYAVGAGGKVGKLLYQADAGPPSHGPVGVSPMGRLLVAGGSERLTVYEAATGAVVEALGWPQRMPTLALAVGPDGSTFAVSTPVALLARWGPTPAEPARGGVWGWLTGRPARQPEAVRELGALVEALAVSPDAGVVAGVGGNALVFWDARTLEERARFELAATFRPSVALTREGEVVAATDRGLVVWPWRELVGAR